VTGDTVRKKIIGMSVVIALLTILCAQSVIAQPPAIPVIVYAWTDKAQYKPGETGTLKISVLNELEAPIEIHNITIVYPWFGYDAEKGEWVGNETMEGNPLATMTSKGTENDHYYTGVKFPIPTDGRVAQFLAGEDIIIDIGTSEGIIDDIEVPLLISSVSLPISITAFEMWMTSLIVAVVVCTIILAAVVFLATRRPRAPRVVAPPPSPPKAKAA